MTLADELESYILRTFIERRPEIRASGLRVEFPRRPGHEWAIEVHGGKPEWHAEINAAAFAFGAGWNAKE